jgi:hypothetical protein
MSSLLTRIIWEAERDSAWEFVQALRHDEGLQAIMREKGLRAAARQVDMRGRRANRPNGPGEAGPVLVGPARAGSGGGSSTQAGNVAFPHGAGTPISNNSTPGRPDVRHRLDTTHFVINDIDDLAK